MGASGQIWPADRKGIANVRNFGDDSGGHGVGGVCGSDACDDDAYLTARDPCTVEGDLYRTALAASGDVTTGLAERDGFEVTSRRSMGFVVGSSV